MKKLTFWKSLFLLCALIVGSTNAWADGSYTITFTCTSNSQQTMSTSTNASTVLANDGSRSYVKTQPFSTVTGSIYYGGSTAAEKKYIRMGATKKTAGLTIDLSDNGKVKATSIVVNCLYFNDNNKGTISVNGMTAQDVPTTSAGDLTFTFGTATDITNIVLATTKATYVYSITVNYSTDTRTATTTAITVPDGFKTDLANETNVAAGQLSATVTHGSPATIIAGAPITWTSTNTDAATVDGSGNVTLKAVGTTTIKAQYEGTTTEYQPSEASYVLNVVNTYAKGQLHNPFTVAEALEFIDALGTGKDTGEDQYYTHGIVSYVGDEISSGKLSYRITTDGVDDEDNCLYIYQSKYLEDADFTTSNKLKVGDEVTVMGQLENYSGTPYSNYGYLISLQTKTTPTFTIDPNITEKSLAAYTHETVDITLTTNTDGAVTCESSNSDVATVALKSAGVYTITAQTKGTANITIKSAMSATYYPASKTIAVTVTDDREDSGIAFANASVTKTWGQSYTGQELTNENNVPVTYSSTDETVATVDEDGVVTVLKAGTTTIKATFNGDATYFATVVSYTLTINKANAGLSFSPNSIEIDLDDDSFVAPTLNNPNSLTVTYGSNNTEVATVDENTGEVTNLVVSAEGTATITATFTGNDNYNSGSASYTIKVVDPNSKGGRLNPYTVTEVENLTVDKSSVYVTGYIVGCVNGNKAYKTTTTQWTDANILLADDRDKSFSEGVNAQTDSKDGLIPVQLGTNALKGFWGIKTTNGAVLGYKVLVRGNEETYFSPGRGVKSTSEVNAVTAPVTISTAEYATYNNANFALDFSETGITVYTAQDKETSVGLTEVTTGQIPANTPVVLHKAVTSSTTINVPVIASADAIEGTNDLRVKDSGDDVENMYVLAKPTGKDVGFYPWKGTKLNAGKVYLQGKDSYGSAREFLGFDGTATGIANVDVNASDNFDANAPMYNLAGQKVSKSYKGVVIVKGKKMLNK